MEGEGRKEPGVQAKQKGAWWAVAVPRRLTVAVTKDDVPRKPQSSQRVDTFECQANLRERHKPHALLGSITRNSQQPKEHNKKEDVGRTRRCAKRCPPAKHVAGSERRLEEEEVGSRGEPGTWGQSRLVRGSGA